MPMQETGIDAFTPPVQAQSLANTQIAEASSRNGTDRF